MLRVLFLITEQRFLHNKHLSSYIYANFLKHFLGKLINWERKGNFKEHAKNNLQNMVLPSEQFLSA